MEDDVPSGDATDAPENLRAFVRHGCAACRSECRATHLPDARPGEGVIVRTDRGIEYALVLTRPAAPDPGGPEPGVEVLRRATAEEEQRQAELDGEGRSTEYRFCQERIRAHDLPMKLVRVEKILGGGRMVFYFLAEGRIDFRELVRDLAREYRMRIELKQIGARDEAKIVGDVSYCGRALCCASWIRDMKPVTMKMAKNQKSTLDPSKISGICGRLLCCLRYEDEVYTDLRRQLPARGRRVRVKSSGMEGLVLHQEVLASRCLVLLDRGGSATVHVDDLELQQPAP